MVHGSSLMAHGSWPEGGRPGPRAWGLPPGPGLGPSTRSMSRKIYRISISVQCSLMISCDSFVFELTFKTFCIGDGRPSIWRGNNFPTWWILQFRGVCKILPCWTSVLFGACSGAVWKHWRPGGLWGDPGTLGSTRKGHFVLIDFCWFRDPFLRFVEVPWTNKCVSCHSCSQASFSNRF